MSREQCCGIAKVFDTKSARKQLARFRRRGPDKTTRILIDALREVLATDGTRTALHLDVGAGLGAIHHELLGGPVSRTIHVDASPSQLEAAREETHRRGHQDDVTFLMGDFVSMADDLAPVDVVTLDRVICCYDDMDHLVRLSASKANRFYGAVFPRDVHWMHIAMAVINIIQRVKRSPFRVFLHDPRTILATLSEAGLRPRTARTTLGWEVVVYERADGVVSVARRQ